ncbi:MAG: TrmH family RNA methyltransferase [Salibacteraceae bacterium]
MSSPTDQQQVALLAHLLSYVSENRRARFDAIIPHRTRHLTVVLENIYQPHNASAVIRTADCLGIQDVHVVENSNEYTLNPGVSLGASNWVDLHRYNEGEDNTRTCLTELKNQGYRILATSPHKNSVAPEDLDLDTKTALVFGKEKEGLSDLAFDLADGYLAIPMYGFTESYNISVSAAICLYTLVQRLHRSEVHWELTPQEQTEIMLNWARGSVRLSAEIEAAFWEANSN